MKIKEDDFNELQKWIKLRDCISDAKDDLTLAMHLYEKRSKYEKDLYEKTKQADDILGEVDTLVKNRLSSMVGKKNDE